MRVSVSRGDVACFRSACDADVDMCNPAASKFLFSTMSIWPERAFGFTDKSQFSPLYIVKKLF
jgi:hypothetical protein